MDKNWLIVVAVVLGIGAVIGLALWLAFKDKASAPTMVSPTVVVEREPRYWGGGDGGWRWGGRRWGWGGRWRR